MTKFQSAVLRYIHDPATAECANLGVILLTDSGDLRVRFCQSFSRVNHFFSLKNSSHLRSQVLNLEAALHEVAADLLQQDLFKKTPKLKNIMTQVFPDDAPHLRWESALSGETNEIDLIFEDLYQNFTGRYQRSQPSRKSRSASDVWRDSFHKPLRDYRIMEDLQEATLQGSLDKRHFPHTWQDGKRLQIIEPLSLDYADPDLIADRAHHWLGVGFGLADEERPHSFTFLVGLPRNRKLRDVAERAMSLIRMIPAPVLFIAEKEARSYAATLLGQMHEAATPDLPGLNL